MTHLYRPAPHGPESLSPREAEVLRSYIELGGYRDIAHRLDLSVSTVKQHATSALRKLGVRSIGQAVVVYDRWQSGRT